MTIQIHVAPLSRKSESKLVLRNGPTSPRSTKTNCCYREKIPTWYLDSTPFSQSFIQEEHGWAASAWGHQWTSTSQFMSSEDVKPYLVHKMGWESWDLPSSLAFTSLLNLSWATPPASAKSRKEYVAGWTWNMTWLTIVLALRLLTCTHTKNSGGALLFPIDTNKFSWREKATGDTLAVQ